MDHCKLCGIEISDTRIQQFGGLCPACTRVQALERRITKLEKFASIHFFIGILLLFLGPMFIGTIAYFDVNWPLILIFFGGTLFLSALVVIIGGKKRMR